MCWALTEEKMFVWCDLLAPVQESPTIYSVFLQENQKEGKSEKDEQAAVTLTSSASASSVVYGANKKNAQLSKKTFEKKKDKQQYTLEDALQQVFFCFSFMYTSYSSNHIVTAKVVVCFIITWGIIGPVTELVHIWL